MKTTFAIRTAALAAGLAALVVAPSHAHAQVPGGLRGPFVGLGVGVENVQDQNLDQHRVGVMLHARAGWGFGSNAVMLEAAWHGIGDEQPRNGDLVFLEDPSGDPSWVRRPKVLGTMSLLASVQVGLPGDLYLRPGAGVAWHMFPVYTFDVDVQGTGVSNEAGPAAQLAVGRTLRLSRRFPVAVEAIGLWSGGEDSTGARWAAGVQVVPMLRF
ncbi:MAG: hypothetical protein ACJ8GN_15210 [Longimicrobiaceae bacterium]